MGTKTAYRASSNGVQDLWGDDGFVDRDLVVILCRHHSEMDMSAETLRKRKLPQHLRRNSSSVFDPAHDSIQVMTLHVSEGQEFPVVALAGAGRMPAEGEDECEEARLFYLRAAWAAST
jgi:superfamily I DNA/RNA helicase